jgi:hypothetical protein
LKDQRTLTVSPGGLVLTIQGVGREIARFEQGVAFMQVPRCDSCRYWKKRNETTGSCLKQFEPDAKLDVAESGGGDLQTEADFGCVQWSAK